MVGLRGAIAIAIVRVRARALFKEISQNCKVSDFRERSLSTRINFQMSIDLRVIRDKIWRVLK